MDRAISRAELESAIVAADERIRQELGRELHDDLCQQLAAIQYLSEALSVELQAGVKKSAAKAREIATLVQAAVDRTREWSHSLCPAKLKTARLNAALRQLTRNVRRHFKVAATFRGEVPPSWLPAEAGLHLFRIAQQAVNNAVRHAHPRRIEVRLAGAAGKIRLTVKNNKTGLAPRRFRDGGIGLRLMQYRADALGGRLQVERRPGGGTAVVCTVSRKGKAPQ